MQVRRNLFSVGAHKLSSAGSSPSSVGMVPDIWFLLSQLPNEEAEVELLACASLCTLNHARTQNVGSKSQMLGD